MKFKLIPNSTKAQVYKIAYSYMNVQLVQIDFQVKH